MAVLVYDRNKKLLKPCTEKRARLLLEKKRADVLNINPFTIRILDKTLEDYNREEIVSANNVTNLADVENVNVS